MSRVFHYLVHYHDVGLLFGAAIVCLFAAFIAFTMLNRAEDGCRRRLIWTWLAAGVAGTGIWSMHLFIMLGLTRDSPLSYDYLGLFASVIPAIVNAGIGFTFCGRQKGSTWLAGTFIGAGFAMMHYMWMSAISVLGTIVWRWDIVAVSIIFSIGFSLAAVAVYRRKAARGIIYPALLLALAMVGLHLIANGAAELHRDGRVVTPQQALDSESLAIVITVTSLLILTIALVIAVIDRVGLNRKLAEAAELKRLADEVIAGAAERERLLGQLTRQYDITTAALDNMAHSLCMYDKDDRLIVWNRRYAEMTEFPEGFLTPGLPFEAIFRYQLENGNVPMTMDQARAQLRSWAVGTNDSEITWRNGRTFHIHREPLENGGWILTHEDITERQRASDRIAYLASHDELTDLPNRRSFADALQEAGDAARKGRSFALLTIDLDRFKEVNDTLGHPVGDEILKETASRLRAIAGEKNVVTRLGGDEFAILQRDVEMADDAAHLAARVVDLLGRPFEFDGHTITVGATVGIALATADDCDADELTKRSDLALYKAKSHSRGSYCFYEVGMDARLRARRDLEMGLRVAIQKAEFELYYQPLLNVASQSIVGFEALVRWHHPTRGMLHPAEFIPAAEDSGLIIPIGEWVLRQACRDAACWPDSVQVSVNLSAAQLKRGDLLAMTKSALDAAGVAPDRLQIELTESVLLHDEDWVRSLLLQLRDLGINIAMDDFGTGYSSLSYLRTFPFNKIKIDKSFVSDMEANPDALAIVQATIGLSRKLGMCTTAEGVETARQLDILTAEGCTEVQGFLVSPPVPADHVWEILQRHGMGEFQPLRAAS